MREKGGMYGNAYTNYHTHRANWQYPKTHRLVSFMDYDLGYFDLDTRMLEPLDNPFGPRLLPM
jgi:hypothetical protein